jgi:uncharacterized Tic20 family protein
MSEPNEYMTPPPPPSGSPGAEERQWAMFAHLSAILGVFIGGLTFVGPLVIWLVKKDSMAFVDDQGKEALNFQITISIVMVALWVVTLFTIFLLSPLTIPLMMLVGLVALVFVVIAGIKANEGVAYRYPFAIRLVK